jgi:tetratricopeptide (TPR) repeat protein
VNFVKKHPHACVIFLLAILAALFQLPFYWVLLAALLYFLVLSLLRFPTSVGIAGYVLERMTGTRAHSLGLYRYAYAHHTKSEYALTSYGLYLLEEGRYEEGLAVFRYLFTLPKIEPMVQKFAYQDLSIAQWKCGDLAGAIATMETMLAEYEYFNASFYTTLGYYYALAGDQEKALLYTNKAIEADESYGPAYDNLGQIAFLQGDYEEAETRFRQALSFKPDLVDSKYYLGCIAEIRHDPEAARAFFTAAAHSKVNGMNTVSKEQIQEKYRIYAGSETN